MMAQCDSKIKSAYKIRPARLNVDLQILRRGARGAVRGCIAHERTRVEPCNVPQPLLQITVPHTRGMWNNFEMLGMS